MKQLSAHFSSVLLVWVQCGGRLDAAHWPLAAQVLKQGTIKYHSAPT